MTQRTEKKKEGKHRRNEKQVLRICYKLPNRFKGLDLIDWVPEELWMEVCDIVRRQWSKPYPRKRNAKRQNSCLRRLYKQERRGAKGKGEKERYTHLNAEFQRIARRSKKDFFSDQCKEIEENNKMGKTRDLFKKLRDLKSKCKTRNYKTPRGEPRQNTLRHTSQQEPLWSTSQNTGNKSKNKQLGSN